ncbi:hypothetical protein H311_05175, partial [Anncaliia algerae PRA109]
ENKFSGVASFTRKDDSLRRSSFGKEDMEKYRSVASNSENLFCKNLIEKEVKKFLFILEGEEKFEKLTLRNKMTLVIKNAEEELKDWFYEKGSEDDLPKTWEEFKVEIIRYCTKTSIDSQRKFFE